MKTRMEHWPHGRSRLVAVLAAALVLGASAPAHILWGQMSPQPQAGGGEVPGAAWFASLQFVALTWHFGGGSYPERYPLRLDEGATLVAHAGVAASLDRHLGGRWFLRGSAVGYADCALLPSAVVHLGIRWTALRAGRHELNGGVGPTFVTRRSWHGRVKNYRGDRLFHGGEEGGWEWFLIAYGAEVEYLYRLAGGAQLQTSAVPWPDGMTFKVGVRWPL